MAGSKQPETADYFINGVKGGNIAILSKAITLVESQNEVHRKLAAEILDGLLAYTGRSFRLGITGVPGVGKSTFIEKFGQLLVEKNHRVAVLAIDPSSSRSKGSILGDKTRMEKLSSMKEVYIRPSPSGGELGGITRSTYLSMLLCEAAGFDFTIIETVGVGQSEVAVNGICDFFLLLMLAGAGDELQGIKRGIMEMADALVVTKADGANTEKAKASRSEYAHAMHFLQAPESGWIPQSLTCSGLNGHGMEEVFKLLEKFRLLVKNNGHFEKKRKQQQMELLKSNAEDILKKRFFENELIRKELNQLQDAKNFDPFAKAKELAERFLSAQ